MKDNSGDEESGDEAGEDEVGEESAEEDLDDTLSIKKKKKGCDIF